MSLTRAPLLLCAISAAYGTSLPCTGASSTLAPSQCAAWQELFDSTFGSAKGCTGTRNSPCDCTEGVHCNGTDIQTITLGQINLQGTIPSSISELTGLQVFELGYNNISGSIPSSIMKMKSLRLIVMSNNSLSGPLPAFNFEQFHNLHGACGFGGGKNSYCAPLPAGIEKCDMFDVGKIATHQC
jgi:hypothetical protein